MRQTDNAALVDVVVVKLAASATPIKTSLPTGWGTHGRSLKATLTLISQLQFGRLLKLMRLVSPTLLVSILQLIKVAFSPHNHSTRRPSLSLLFIT